MLQKFAQVRLKSVVIPCTYTDFRGITTDYADFCNVQTVSTQTVSTPSKSVFMDVFPV